MKILCVSQNKGGTGKTSTSRLVAEYAALKGKRVLCIDLDPQCSLSQRFLQMQSDSTSADGVLPPIHPEWESDDPEWTSGTSSISGVYTGHLVVPYPTQIPGLDILPGDGQYLRDCELVNKQDTAEKIHGRLRDFLRGEDVMAQYDLTVIDTSPSKGPLTISAMRAATHVVIPTKMEPQGIEGLQGMLQLWMSENRLRDVYDSIELIGILPNMFRPVALQEGLLEGLLSDPVLGPMMIPHKLGMRTAFAESDNEIANARSVFKLPDTNLARIEAEAFCQYVLDKMEM